MRIFLYIISFFIGLSATAQDVQFKASLNKNIVGLNESFTLTYSLNTSGGKFKPPVLSDNFKIYSGPNQSTSMSYVNGRISSSIAYQYIMVPINIGKFVVEPATIEVDGITYTSNALEVEVVQTKSQPKANPNPSRNEKQQGQQKQSSAPKNIEKNLFLKLSVSKSEAVQGEPIVATYKLYNRLDLTNIEGQKFPDYVGFYTNEVPIDQTNNGSREVIDNVIYQVYTLKKTTLFPQRTGELEIRPLELFATIREREPTPINTFFGPRYRYKNKRIELKSNAVTITVKPLPSNAPKSFSGSVGTYNIQSSVDNRSIQVNNAINLKYVVTGSGNIDLVELPEIDFPVDFEVYDPKVKVSSQNTKGTVSGKKTIEYLLIPRVVGDFNIPKVEFTYYNPNTNQYETASAPEYTIQVSDDGSGTPTKATVQTKRDIQQIGTDIRFIKTSEESFLEDCSSFFGSVWFFLWLILPILLGTGLWIAFRRYEDMQSDKVGMKKRRAGKIASKQLKAASQALTANDKAAFYLELSKGLNTYLSFKLALGTADLSKEIIANKLTNAGIKQELIQQVLHILEQCEMARYAPSAVSDENTLYASTEELIENLEKELK